MTRARFETGGSEAYSLGFALSASVGPCERVIRAALVCVLVLACACADAPVESPPRVAPAPARTGAEHATLAPAATPQAASAPASHETEHTASAPAATPPSSLEPAPLPGYVPPGEFSASADPTKVREIPGSHGAKAPVDQLLLQLEPGVGREVAESIAAAEGGAIIGQLSSIGSYYQLRLPTDTFEELRAAIERARSVPGVASANIEQIATPEDLWGPLETGRAFHCPGHGPFIPIFDLYLEPCAGREVAVSVAAAEHAVIVGQMPSMGLYQLRLPRGTTVEQLQAAMDRADRRRGVAGPRFNASARLDHETPAETRARRPWGDCVEALAEVHLEIRLEPGAGREVAESVAAAEGGEIVAQGQGPMAGSYLLRLPIETEQELQAASLRVEHMPGVASAFPAPGSRQSLRSDRTRVR